MRRVARFVGFWVFGWLLLFALLLGEAWLGGGPMPVDSAVVFLLVGVLFVILISLVLVLRNPPSGDGQ